MLRATSEFVSAINVERPPRWLTLTGKSGTGKTLLAKSVFRAFMDTIRHHPGFDSENQRLTGQRGQFVDWRNLCSVVKEGGWGWVEDLCGDDLVIIDDVGAEYDRNGFTASVLDRLLNARMRKWTMLTCNIPLPEIADRLDSRIASRMIRDGNVVIECDTTDFAMRDA